MPCVWQATSMCNYYANFSFWVIVMQWVNIATVIFLLFFPTNEHFSALVFSMNEGPLSGALVVWQCAWVFGSREHTFRYHHRIACVLQDCVV